MLSRGPPTSDCGLTPPVFTPSTSSNEDDSSLAQRHKDQLDDHGLRPMLTEFITTHSQQASFFTTLYCVWLIMDCFAEVLIGHIIGVACPSVCLIQASNMKIKKHRNIRTTVGTFHAMQWHSMLYFMLIAVKNNYWSYINVLNCLLYDSRDGILATWAMLHQLLVTLRSLRLVIIFMHVFTMCRVLRFCSEC